MKIEIELTDKEIEEIKELENCLVKKIMAVRAGIYEMTIIDKMAGKIYDAYNRQKKGGAK